MITTNQFSIYCHGNTIFKVAMPASPPITPFCNSGLEIPLKLISDTRTNNYIVLSNIILS